MPYLNCCVPSCKTQISPKEKLKKIGEPQFYPLFLNFMDDNRYHDPSSIICRKHHAQVKKETNYIRLFYLYPK